MQAKVELLRNGKKSDAELSLSAVNRLIPEHLDNRPPSYLILAGLVFTQVRLYHRLRKLFLMVRTSKPYAADFASAAS